MLNDRRDADITPERRERYESRLEMSFGNLVRRLSTSRAQTEAA